MSPAAFEPAIPASERRQTCDLDGMATGIGLQVLDNVINYTITHTHTHTHTESLFVITKNTNVILEEFSSLNFRFLAANTLFALNSPFYFLFL
jgi:hypothetical protein